MHESNPHLESGMTAIQNVLKVVVSFMKTKILSNENDHISIVLYNCDKSANTLQADNIYILQDLDVPDASRIKEIEGYITD